MSQAIIWTIASIDDHHNIGIQADTINALGGYGYYVSMNKLSDVDFTAELAALTVTSVASVIKIGAIATPSQVVILADFLQGYKQRHPEIRIIYEPLFILLSELVAADTAFIRVIKMRLLPIVDVLIVRQAALASQSTTELFSVIKQDINTLCHFGVKGVCAIAVAIEDGQQPIILDIYADQQREVLLSTPDSSIEKDHNRGIFSAALATVIAQDYPVDDALVLARAYLNQVGEVWPADRRDFPQIVFANTALGARLGLVPQMQLAYDFAPCDTNRLGLYPVVDSIEWLNKILEQGVKTLQLRIKDKTLTEVTDDIKAAVILGRQYQARLFINDYWQLAIEFGAYGVHLGQEDMLTADFVAIKNAGLKLGLSTHGYYEILRAHQIKPSYIALGHIYPTVTKDMLSKPQGLLRLQRYADLMQDYSLVAIGGINTIRAPQVVATGVGSIAVVTAITRAIDYKQAIVALLAIVEEAPILQLKHTQEHADG